MATLNWTNVAAPDISGTSNILRNAAEALNTSVGLAKDTLTGYREGQTKADSDRAAFMLAEVANHEDFATFLNSEEAQGLSLSPEIQKHLMSMQNNLLDMDQGRANIKLTGAETEGQYATTANTNARTNMVGVETQNMLNTEGRTANDYNRKIGHEDSAIAANSAILGMGVSSGWKDKNPSDYIVYNNQNATRNDPLSEDLVSRLGFLGDMGVTMKVVSGGQEDNKANGTGSTRHNHGNAADADFYVGDRKLSWHNEKDKALLQQIVVNASANGITGIGAGDDYMGDGRMHIGVGGSEATWGAGGKGTTALDWVKQAAEQGKSMRGEPRSAVDLVNGGQTPYNSDAIDAQEILQSVTTQQPAPIQNPYQPAVSPQISVNNQQEDEVRAVLAQAGLPPEMAQTILSNFTDNQNNAQTRIDTVDGANEQLAVDDTLLQLSTDPNIISAAGAEDVITGANLPSSAKNALLNTVDQSQYDVALSPANEAALADFSLGREIGKDENEAFVAEIEQGAKKYKSDPIGTIKDNMSVWSRLDRSVFEFSDKTLQQNLDYYMEKFQVDRATAAHVMVESQRLANEALPIGKRQVMAVNWDSPEAMAKAEEMFSLVSGEGRRNAAASVASNAAQSAQVEGLLKQKQTYESALANGATDPSIKEQLDQIDSALNSMLSAKVGEHVSSSGETITAMLTEVASQSGVDFSEKSWLPGGEKRKLEKLYKAIDSLPNSRYSAEEKEAMRDLAAATIQGE